MTVKDVCEDLTNESHKTFIKDYLQVYPNSSLAVYRVGQSLNVDCKGIQKKCVVEQVDCQLIQVDFKVRGFQHGPVICDYYKIHYGWTYSRPFLTPF